MRVGRRTHNGRHHRDGYRRLRDDIDTRVLDSGGRIPFTSHHSSTGLASKPYESATGLESLGLARRKEMAMVIWGTYSRRRDKAVYGSRTTVVRSIHDESLTRSRWQLYGTRQITASTPGNTEFSFVQTFHTLGRRGVTEDEVFIPLKVFL